MTMTIWKFSVPITEHGTIRMPQGAKILSVQVQNDMPHIWALVDPDAHGETRLFAVHGTGHIVPDDGRVFIGTFQLDGGNLVFHLFERP